MRTIQDAITKVQLTLSAKGLDYGPTYRRVASALSVEPQYSILVRILEKCMRVDNLLKASNSPVLRKYTKMQEEFLDIACYAVLAMFESNGGGDIPEEEEDKTYRPRPNLT